NNGASVKAGSAFDGTPNSHKIKQDVAGNVSAGTGTVESDPRSGGTATYASDKPANVSHKICGTGEGESHTVTRKTNCRSGAPTPHGSETNSGKLGLGIGSEDVVTNGNVEGKALTSKQWDTLVKAFEANDASTSTTTPPAGPASAAAATPTKAVKALSKRAPHLTGHRIAIRLSRMWREMCQRGLVQLNLILGVVKKQSMLHQLQRM
ncbi:MAG: hypothetical protein ACTJLL_00300, partial [Anaplasma sp.]